MRPSFVRGFPRAAVLCVLGCSLMPACAEPSLASPDEIERAKAVYTDCVENEIGMEVTELDIRSNGDITVGFGEGFTEEKAELAIAICEARIGSVLEPGGISVLGPPPNLGRPGSNADLSALLTARVALGFEGAVIVESMGQRRVTAGFGTLAADSERAPDADTAFDCGSIMKEITAATVFLLEEDGMLSREQSLAAFFPDIPGIWRTVTIQQVLTHSAGFDEYHDTEGDFEAMDRSTALAAIFAQEPRFEPGTDTAYSNSGYTLLAALIEDVTGEEYASAIRSRVFEPLRMHRSGLYAEALWADGNVAIGRGADVYAGNDPSTWPAPSWALIGNGGLVSTLNDLLILARAFEAGSLFEKATREAFVREHLGRMPGSIAGKPVLGYAGGNDFGFNAVVIQVPEDSTVVLAASHVWSAVTTEILGVEAVQVLYGDVVQLPE